MFDMRHLTGVTTLELDQARCNGCQMCRLVCPHAVFAIEEKKARIVDADACMECGACAGNCPEGALTVRTGVGCAYGIILGAIRGTEPTCDCGPGSDACC